MGRCSGKARTNNSDETEGNPPPSQSPRKAGSKLGCAFKALSCSSRAEKEGTDKVPLITSEASIEHYPEAKVDMGEAETDSKNVLRVASEDTHETPLTSNIDPDKSPRRVSFQTEAERRMDEICQKHFNTPLMIRSTPAFGDTITPLESPVNSAESNNNSSQMSKSPSSDVEKAKEILEMPAMTSPRSREQRKESEEKKMDDFQMGTLQLNPDNAAVQIGRDEVKATITQINPRATEKVIHDNYTNSSFSSVSSFAEVLAATSAGSSKRLTSHPFFWRSHPKLSVTSYEDSRNHKVISQRFVVQSTEFKISNHRVARKDLQCRPFQGCNEDGCAPYLDPVVVKKLWMESKPFQLKVNSNWHSNSDSNRHPLGPPSPRSHPLVQSLASFASIPAAVFNRSENNSFKSGPIYE